MIYCILALLACRIDQFIHVIGTAVCGVVVLCQHLAHLLYVLQSVGKVIEELELFVMLHTLRRLNRFERLHLGWWLVGLILGPAGHPV